MAILTGLSSASKPDQPSITEVSVDAIAAMLAYQDFPTKEDIMAIASIESNFNRNARNGISKGVMQVNRGSFELGVNMSQGVSLLREYYELLGSKKAAVLAYNAGPSNYRRGRYKISYWKKFQKERVRYESLANYGGHCGRYNSVCIPMG